MTRDSNESVASLTSNISDCPETTSNLIEIKLLTKRYGRVRALNELDLSVKEGEVYGFLGRNGAGKSTTIRIMMGITKPTSGTLLLFGKSLGRNRNELRQSIGYVAQEQNFYGWMTPQSIGKFVRGFFPTWDDEEYRRLIRILDLPESRKIRTFSGGMRAKLALALALAHRPPLLLLDEPTAGLDAVARREFIEMVRDQAENTGRTTFFSSHLIDEVEAAADRVGIIENGHMYYQGPLSTLSDSIRILRHPSVLDSIPELPHGIVDPASGLQVLRDRTRHGERQVIIKNTRHPDTFETLLSSESAWTMERMSLEEIFIEMVTKPVGLA